MSEIAVATARVIVRPDTTQFTRQLLEEVNRAVSRVQTAARPIQIQAALGGFSTAALAQTAALTSAQEAATTSTLGLASAAQVENSAFGQQAVILQAATAATNQKAGADATAAAAATTHARQMGQVRTAALASGASMLGLRGAVLTAGAAFLGATVAFQAFGRAVSSAANLETQLNVFRVTAGATAAEMDRVSQAARELGRDITLPGVSASEAAEAMLALARAGLSVEESIAGARGALQLSLAAEIDFARAAELVAGNLNAFALAGDQAVRVADLLTGAANESQGSIEDMGIGLRQVAGAASLLGLTVEDTVTLLTQLTRAGLAGSDAGTTLRVALVRLARPDVREEVEKLVGSLEDLQGNLDPEKIVKLAEEIQKTGGRLDRTNRLYELFGENALRVIGLLGQEGVAGFRNISDEVTEAGLAAETAGARTEGLRGDAEALGNEMAELGITLGQVVDGPLGALARVATTAAGAINDVTSAAEEQGVFQSFGDSIARLGSVFGDLNFQLQTSVRASALGRGEFNIFRATTDEVTESIQGLVSALEDARRAASRSISTPDDQGLGVQQILNRVQGFDSAETRARIRGDSNEILGVLEAERAFLESQLQRRFVTRRPELQRRLEQALLGVTNDIAAITRAGATDARRAAQEALAEKREADQALLDLLSSQRQDIDIQAAGAAAADNITRQIRLADRLQALIQQQIATVRRQISDEATRRQAIRELRIALIESRREEDALRAERAAQIAANRQEGIELDVELAEITGNVEREIAARQRLIALLRKQQADVKKGTAEWKRLRNEIARQQQAIKDARDQADEDADDGRRAQEFFFEQLQAQQGFAANLLGNLITGPTAGLVGVPSPSPAVQVNLGAALGAAAGVAEGRSKSAPTAGQASTTNELLSAILSQLKLLNQTTDAPEAINNKKTGAAYMDGIGGGSGAAAVM